MNTPKVGNILRMERSMGTAKYKVSKVNKNMITIQVIENTFNDGIPLGNEQTYPWDIIQVNGLVYDSNVLL
jgi:hypothetical protein